MVNWKADSAERFHSITGITYAGSTPKIRLSHDTTIIIIHRFSTMQREKPWVLYTESSIYPNGVAGWLASFSFHHFGRVKGYKDFSSHHGPTVIIEALVYQCLHVRGGPKLWMVDGSRSLPTRHTQRYTQYTKHNTPVYATVNRAGRYRSPCRPSHLLTKQPHRLTIRCSFAYRKRRHSWASASPVYRLSTIPNPAAASSDCDGGGGGYGRNETSSLFIIIFKLFITEIHYASVCLSRSAGCWMASVTFEYLHHTHAGCCSFFFSEVFCLFSVNDHQPWLMVSE